MNELPKAEMVTFQGEQKFGVPAWGLFMFLGQSPINFARWCDRNITNAEFCEEGIDYVIIDLQLFVTIDYAKIICMADKTEVGNLARRYFIQVEKEYIQSLKDKLLEGHTRTLLSEYGGCLEPTKQLEGFLPGILGPGGQMLYIQNVGTEAEKFKTLYERTLEYLKEVRRENTTLRKLLNKKGEAIDLLPIILPEQDIKHLERLFGPN